MTQKPIQRAEVNARALRGSELWTAIITSRAASAFAPDLLPRINLRCFAFNLYLLALLIPALRGLSQDHKN